MKIFFTFAFAITAVWNIKAQDTLVLYPMSDVSLGYHDNFNTANNNYRFAKQFAGFVIPGFSGGINSNRGIIKFDLSSLPENVSIISAKLDLFAFNDTSSLQLSTGHYGSNSSYLKVVTQNWEEETVTWNNQPSATEEDMVILEQSINQNQDYLGINLLNITNKYYTNIYENLGFKFGLINESLGNNLSFHSSESITPEKRPRLEIVFTDDNVSIESLTNKKIPILFPNPVENELLFKNNVLEIGSEYTIIDITNRIIIQGEVLLVEKIDVSKLKPGSYFIQLNNKSYHFEKK